MNSKKDEQNFTILDWWKKVFLENYANFDGRARRSEYWYFILLYIIIVFFSYAIILLGVFSDIPVISIIGSVFLIVYLLGSLIPWLALAARRLHDTNKTGWLLLLMFVPFGSIVLFIFYCLEGDKGINQYGSDPKSTYIDDINTIGKE